MQLTCGVSLLNKGLSNIIPAYSEGSMMPELGSMPITEVFPTSFMNVKPRASSSNSDMQQWGISVRPLGVKPSLQATSKYIHILM